VSRLEIALEVLEHEAQQFGGREQWVGDVRDRYGPAPLLGERAAHGRFSDAQIAGDEKKRSRRRSPNVSDSSARPCERLLKKYFGSGVRLNGRSTNPKNASYCSPLISTLVSASELPRVIPQSLFQLAAPTARNA
jgi:hypothetical protein